MTRTSAQALIGIGVLVAAVSLLANPFGLGRYPGFGWVQEVGVIIGILEILAGFYLRVRAPRVTSPEPRRRKGQRPAHARGTRAATAHLEAVGLDGSKVKLPLAVVLDREVAERPSARAIREGKNLE